MTGNQAGGSAGEQARRAREKIQRLERSVAAWEAGAYGEQATGQVLRRLDPAEWFTWHDVRWPGRPRANIDHVVVGPPGVFVIDSKNWTGDLTMTDGVLRQNGYSRETAVAGAAEAGLAVFGIVPDVPVHPVLCFVRDEPLSGWVRDVMFCSTANLDAMVRTRPTVLSPDQVRRVATRLERGLLGPSRAATSTPTPMPAPRPARARPRRRTGRSSVRAVALAVALVFGLSVAAPALTAIGHEIAQRQDR